MDKVHVYTDSGPSRGNGNSSPESNYRTYASGQQSAEIGPGEYVQSYPPPLSNTAARAREVLGSESDRSPLFATGNADYSVLGYQNGSGSCIGSCCELTSLLFHRMKELCGMLCCEESFEGRRLRPACRIVILIAGVFLAFLIGYCYALAFHNAPKPSQLVEHEKVFAFYL